MSFGQDWNRFLPEHGPLPELIALADQFAGETICITGAAGDIGSALAAAILPHARSLVLLDSSESGIFDLQTMLESQGQLRFCNYVLGSVTDSALLAETFRAKRPGLVIHAAAFKHVSLLENNLFAAVANNALGTDTLVRTAAGEGVEQLLLVSTDKAANPHSVMGVSKRIAELFALSHGRPGCQVNAVRLGNVIGTRGSVVPLFREQIAAGGPVRVTDIAAYRYFITQGEAVAAILTAAKAECNGTVLLPDLGEPVRISDLAQFLIQQDSRGHEISTDLIGLRPGEKLREELLGTDESIARETPEGLRVLRCAKRAPTSYVEARDQLAKAVASRDATALVSLLRELVPTYRPSSTVLNLCGPNRKVSVA